MPLFSVCGACAAVLKKIKNSFFYLKADKKITIETFSI